jgi:hypothetical protein
MPRVNLEQLGAGSTSGRDGQTRRQKLAAHEPERGKRASDAAEHIARTAAHFEHRVGFWEVLVERPYNEAVARSEPKASILNRRQVAE